MIAEAFAYEKLEQGIKIWRCYSYGDQVQVPECLNELPVTELAPYVFSAHMDKDEFEKRIRSGKIRFGTTENCPVEQRDLPPELCGMKLGIVGLPKSMKKIGRYAFYNCNALTGLTFYSGNLDLGAGLFTGCHHVENLVVSVLDGGDSGFRQILAEFSEELRVEYSEQGEFCKLIFPEFYEEGDEDTPAKNTKINYHGSGLHFRNCFKENRFQFDWYDERFIRAQSWERGALALEIALLRLIYPMKLNDSARKNYEEYVKANLFDAGMWMIKNRERKSLTWLMNHPGFRGGITEELLKGLIEYAREEQDTEEVGFLMDVKHRMWKPKAKSFDL